MTRMTLTRAVFLVFLSIMSTAAAADVLLIEQVREAGMMDVPANGMSMSEVESRFGAPNARGSAVGNPPITRWDYDRWSVYFEYDAVLFTVLEKGEVLGDEGTAEEAGTSEQ